MTETFFKKAKVDDVKTMLSCATSRREWKLKMWKRRCRAGLPQKVKSWRCETELFARGILQNLKVENVKTNLSRETPFKKWKVKDVKPKLSFQTYLKEWQLKMCKRSFPSFLWNFFAMRLLICETSLLWDLFALRSLWDFFAVRLLCCETSLLWDLFAVRLLCCGTSWRPKIRNTEVRLQISFDK